jgi:hypothetical protein
MYIAMNRFKGMKGAESAFEHVWLPRETHLDRVPEFLGFHLLRGPERYDRSRSRSTRSDCLIVTYGEVSRHGSDRRELEGLPER